MENNKVDLTVPTIYAFGPHGIFALAPSIQAILNEYLMGSCFHVLAAPVVFWVPGYNMLLKSLGFKSVDEKSFSKLMNEKKSIGIVPGGIAEMHYAARANEEVMVVNNRKVLTVTHLLTHSPNHLLTLKGIHKNCPAMRCTDISLLLFWKFESFFKLFQ
jgi:hypothetical protein